MVRPGTPLNSVNNALLFRTSKADLGRKHIEENTVINMFGKGASNSEYLGMLKLWANRYMINVPLISMTELSNNVMYVNGLGASLGFSLPYRLGFPYVKENLEANNPRPGLNQTKAKLVLSTNAYSNRDVITWDKWDGLELRITEDEIVPYGTGWLYTVVLAKADAVDDWIPQYAFEPGREYVKVGFDGGEFDTIRSGLSPNEWGLAHYALETSNTDRGVQSWITRNADMLSVSSNNQDIMNSNFWGEINDSNAVINLILAQKDSFGNIKTDMNGQAIPDMKTLKWMPYVVYLMQKELAKLEENDLMWGKGREYYDAAGKKFRTGAGYLSQLRSGNYIQYTDSRQLLSILKNSIAELFSNSPIEPYKRLVKVRVGTGALLDLQKEFQQEFKIQNPFIVWAKDIQGLLTGNNMNLEYNGYRFTRINWPEGSIELEYTPSLDYQDNGAGVRSQGGIFGQYDIRSYSIIVEDVTAASYSNQGQATPNFEYSVKEGFNNGANVVMIKPKNFTETIVSYRIGTYVPEMLRAYVGSGPLGGHVASSDKKGFGIIMDNASSLWIKDVTRTMFIEKVDPSKEYFINNYNI